MVLFVYLALSALLLTQPGSCWTSSDAATTTTLDSSQSEMVELVERLLKARQEEQQAAHSQRLDRLETLVAQQIETISSQGRQLREQAETISSQARLLRAQAETDSGLQTLVGQQAETISHLESQLSSQDARMSYQGRLLRALAETLHGQQDFMGQLRAAVTQLQGHAVTVSSDLLLKTSRHNLPAGELETEGHVTSQSHERMARADDAGPLEAVVNQVGQQVTQLDADLQAFRTQTASDLQTFSSDLQTVRDANSQQDQQIQDARTSTFVRWGSSQCSSSSQLVYSGVVGGSLHTATGAATNYLCLTMDPVFADTVPSSSARAYLYGGEYETLDSHSQKDPVCAVCRSSHSTTIMIPGTNVCTAGWQRQYSGYLMGGYEGHVAASEFICVDSAMESRDSSNTNQNGKLLFYAATRCGSLPCDPYVNDKIVTCVVCSL